VARRVALLRGINLGPRNRIAMAELRALLADAGFDEVRTYLQSGNVVLESDASPEQVACECERQIADHFGLDIRVVVRTRDELARVVQRNPLAEVAVDPKRYQVSFLADELDRDVVDMLNAAGRRTGASGRDRPRGLRLAPGRRRPIEAVGAARWRLGCDGDRA
jgi:uncharacterized protein (DUF1697 family)